MTVNFGLQLLVDLTSVSFVDKIGYRASMLLAHGFAAAGLVFLDFHGDDAVRRRRRAVCQPVGAISGAFGDDFTKGILAAVLFPLLLLAGILFIKKAQKKKTAKGF